LRTSRKPQTSRGLRKRGSSKGIPGWYFRKIPKNTPFKGQYEGWCYASQRCLANRVGTTEDYVRKCVALFEEDGVIATRRWHDPMGYQHQEYHVDEEVVTAHQRAEGYMEHERKQPRRGGNKQPNKGSFKPGNRVRATGHDSRSHDSRMATGSHTSRKHVVKSGFPAIFFDWLDVVSTCSLARDPTIR
jgi:hypothetical protein